MGEIKDLGTFVAAKTALARAQEINEGWAHEMVRLQSAAALSVTVILCLLLTAAAFAFMGMPEQQRLDRIAQESSHAYSR